MAVITFSPVEVFADVIRSLTDRDIVKHVVVGPANHVEQQEGVISILDAGVGRQELYLPLVYPRMQLRCIAPSMEECERIGRHVGFAFNDFPGRMIGHQDSDGNDYLVHTLTASGGPSAHRDTDNTWEYLMFAETMMGTIPVSSGP